MISSFDVIGDGTSLDPSISQTDADPSPDAADVDLTREQLIPSRETRSASRWRV